MNDPVLRLHDPQPERLGRDPETFLRQLGGPACLSLSGRDPSRSRVLVTLLHGNEPSGLKALLHLLAEGLRPAVTTHCYITAVAAALLPPAFSHRQLPHGRDLNRCFKPPFEADREGRVSKAMLDDIARLAPEAVVDMHNTSGEGPSFAVTRMYDKKHERIVSLFTDRLIITDLRLGSIMERSSHELPIVTIECGGAFEASSDRIAREGLRRFMELPDIFTGPDTDWGPEILSNPVRVELSPGTGLAYGEGPGPDGLTLRVDVEHFNFTRVPEDTRLGWLATESAPVRALDPQRQDHFETFYYCRHGGLYTRIPQKMFMITSNAAIARSDCLWYSVKA